MRSVKPKEWWFASDANVILMMMDAKINNWQPLLLLLLFFFWERSLRGYSINVLRLNQPGKQKKRVEKQSPSTQQS